MSTPAATSENSLGSPRFEPLPPMPVSEISERKRPWRRARTVASQSPRISGVVLATYGAEHRFADYRATVSATNLAETGVMVREEYLSAR